MQKPGIYKIHCIASDKFYIGSSVNVYNRICRHKSRLRKQNHYNNHLQNAFNKYGEESFTFEFLESCRVTNLKQREKELLDEHFPSGRLYNKSRTTDSPNGIEFSEEDQTYILQEHASGRSMVSIGKSLQVSDTTVRAFLQSQGVDTSLKLADWHQKYSKEFFIKEREKGKSLTQIENELGLYKGALKKKFRSLGLSTELVPRVWTKSKKQQLIRMKKAKISDEEIADILEVTTNAIKSQWTTIKRKK